MSNLAAKPKPMKRTTPPRTPRLGPFRGVSQIDIAPVNIGNTVRSSKQSVIPTRDGIRVVGRDFVMAVGGQLTDYTSWCLVGGLGLSPVALNASGLRAFFQSYQKYKWERCTAHYVTSSPTSTSGDVLIMYHNNHGGPKVDHTSLNFLSYALSTDTALIGPQWTNHSVELIDGEHEWCETDILNTEDVQHQADGELLIYARATTNNAAADSPGIILIDYDIEFQNRMLNPRIGVLPASIFKFTPTGMHVNYSPAQYEYVTVDILLASRAYNGVPTIPAGASAGDVFQVVLDLQNSVFTDITATAGFVAPYAATGNTSGSVYIPFPFTTGTTLYAVAASVSGNGSFVLYPNYEAVWAGNSLRYAAAGVSITINMAVTMCCVGSVSNKFLQANIG